MAIKATEIGKQFNVGTGFILTGFTDLQLKFTQPDGTTFTLSNAVGSRVTAPAVPVVDPDVGTLAASTYMQITTIAGDFLTPGTYVVCATFISATQTFYGDNAPFVVEEAC